jgi:hypothetical protein
MERISDKWLWGEQGDPDETAVSLRCELKGAETLFFFSPADWKESGLARKAEVADARKFIAMPSEDEEVQELKQMFSSPTKSKKHRSPARKPAWDSTPLRSRPSALVGLRPVTREPWAIDEDVYNRKFEMRDVGVPDRYLDKTARVKENNSKYVDYLCRFDQKYSEMNGGYNRFDGEERPRVPPFSALP